MKLPEFVAGPAQQIRTVDPGQAAAMGAAIGRVGGAMMDVAQAQQKYQQRIKAERTQHEAVLVDASFKSQVAGWEQEWDVPELSGGEVNRLLGDDSGVKTTQLVTDRYGNTVEQERVVPRREWYAQAWEKQARSALEVAASNYTDPVMRERFLAAGNADIEIKKAALFREGEEEARRDRGLTEEALYQNLINQGNTVEAMALVESSLNLNPAQKIEKKAEVARVGELWGWREVLLSGTVEEKAELARQLRADGAEWLNKPETVIAIANQLEADVKAASPGGAGENLEKAQRQYTTNMQKQIGVAVNGLKGAEREAQVNSIYRELISDPKAVNMMTAEGFKYLQEWHKTNGFMESDAVMLGKLEGFSSADLAGMSNEEFDVYLLKLNPEDQAKWEQARAKAQTQPAGARTKADDIKTARNQRFEEVFGSEADARKSKDKYKEYQGNQRAFNALLEYEMQLRVEQNGGRDLSLTEFNEVLDEVTIAEKVKRKAFIGYQTTVPDMADIDLPVAQRAFREYNRRSVADGQTPLKLTVNNLWLLEKALKMDGNAYDNFNTLRNQWQEATR